jgi:protein SCO1/2
MDLLGADMRMTARTNWTSWLRAGTAVLCVSVLSAGPEEPRIRRSVETCTVPDVVLVNQDGQKVRLKQVLESDEPIILNFIYGSCTTVCPTLSAGFATLQTRLGDHARKVHLISITIDPKRDTPQAMKDYLRRFRAKAGWDFLTGTRADLDQAMHGLNTFIPDLSSMVPITMLHPHRNGKWIRVFGLLSSSEFLEECKKAGIP